MVAESCRMGFVIQIDSLSGILGFLSGFKNLFESFIVKEIKTRYWAILNRIPGQQLVGRAHLRPLGDPFWVNNPFIHLKVKFERDGDPLGCLGLRYKKIIKNQKILNHFDKRPRCIA